MNSFSSLYNTCTYHQLLNSYFFLKTVSQQCSSKMNFFRLRKTRTKNNKTKKNEYYKWEKTMCRNNIDSFLKCLRESSDCKKYGN